MHMVPFTIIPNVNKVVAAAKTPTRLGIITSTMVYVLSTYKTSAQNIPRTAIPGRAVFTSCTLGATPVPVDNARYRNNQVPCLLYTSDAADEEDSVDLGGRRIIKK